MKSNLNSLDYTSKRLVLEALDIRVVVNGLDVNIEGVIPIQPDVNCVRLTGTRF